MAERFQRNDRIFLGTAALLLFVVVLWFSFFQEEVGGAVNVTVNGQLYGTYSLKKDRTVEIVIGEKTTNVLLIHDGKADMTEADCPDQVCVRQGWISNSVVPIACLPHKLVVQLESAPGGVDGATG